MDAATIKPEERGVEPLFHEVTLLANLIKKAAFKSQDEDVFLAVGRNIMESLSNKGPLTVPALAELRSSSRQNIQIIVNRLVRLGCVEVRPNPGHKKSGLVFLTDAGRTALAKTTGGGKKLFEKVSSHCSEREIRRGLDLVKKLREVLENEDDATLTPGRLRGVRASEISKPARIEKTAEPDLPHSSVAEDSEVEENSLPYNLL
jgi:DNA-binding MarR family transcriptional regulator